MEGSLPQINTQNSLLALAVPAEACLQWLRLEAKWPTDARRHPFRKYHSERRRRNQSCRNRPSSCSCPDPSRDPARAQMALAARILHQEPCRAQKS